jgi:hypothetical protein
MVVDHLQSNHKESGVACIYLNHKETNSQTPQNIIGGLWRQLIIGRSIPAPVHALYKAHHEKHTRPPLNDLQRALNMVVSEYPKVYFIIDALDEYPEEHYSILMDCLATLRPAVNLMITSRPHIPLESFLHDLVLVEIRATDDDITHYVEKQISQSRKLFKHVQTHPDLQDYIRLKITNNADGM